MTSGISDRTLRQRYLALLVPAIARVNRVYSQRTLAERAKAVRDAASRCLVQASTGQRHRRSGYYNYRRYGSCSLPMMMTTTTTTKKTKILMTMKRWRCSGSNKRRVSYMKALRWAKAHPTSRSAHDYNHINTQAAVTSTDHQPMIPDESDLQRLQRAILPGLLAGGGNPAAAALHHNQSAAAAGADPDGATDIHPADLLTQAAHYIMALQVQVDALQVLSQSIFNHSPPS